jgi:hypothetical protein
VLPHGPPPSHARSGQNELSSDATALARHAAAAAGLGSNTRAAVEEVTAPIPGVAAVDALRLAGQRHAAAAVSRQTLTTDAHGRRRARSAVDRVAAAVTGLPAREVLLGAARGDAPAVGGDAGSGNAGIAGRTSAASEHTAATVARLPALQVLLIAG